MSNRWRGGPPNDIIGCLMAIAVGAVGFPVVTYLFVPFQLLISRTPVLFWSAMLAPFALWLAFQCAISWYAALMIRPVPRRDWPRTMIAGVVVLVTTMMSMGPWLARTAYALLYGAAGPPN